MEKCYSYLWANTRIGERWQDFLKTFPNVIENMEWYYFYCEEITNFFPGCLSEKKKNSIIFPFHPLYCQVATTDPKFLLLIIPAGKNNIEAYFPSVELLKRSDFVFNIKSSWNQIIILVKSELLLHICVAI